MATKSGPGSKSLDPEKNRILRALAQRILDECKGNQSRAAKRLGVSQGFLSEFISEKRGAGPRLIEGLAALFPDETVAAVSGMTAREGAIEYSHALVAVERRSMAWSDAVRGAAVKRLLATARSDGDFPSVDAAVKQLDAIAAELRGKRADKPEVYRGSSGMPRVPRPRKKA